MKFMLAQLAAAAVLAATPAAQIPGIGEIGEIGGNQAQDGPRLKLEAKFNPPTARAGEVATLEVHVDINEGWHIYGSLDTNSPTTLEITDLGALKLEGEAMVPAGDPHEQFGETYFWIMGKAVLKQQIRVPEGTAAGDITVKGEMAYMACTERECDEATADEFSATLKVEAGATRAERSKAEEVTPPPKPKKSGGRGNLATMDLWAFILAAIGGGLFALAMPCTYPMIPITISFFTKQADQRGGNVLPLALMYGAGIVAIFILIGVLVGAPIAKYAANPILNLGIGVVFLLFALSLFGLITLQPPQALMNMANKASGQGGFVGVFLMGATLVVTSFTCTAPVAGGLLALGGEGGDVGRAILGMGVFGLTMAVPFVFLSLAPGKIASMPRSGEWMNTLKVFLGFVEVAAAIKFISNADMVWGWKWLSRELFLFSWAGVLGIAGVFLLGMIKLKGESGEIGPGRLVGALTVLFFAIYCAYGAMGNRLDWVMTSIAPDYSNSIAGVGGKGEAKPSHIWVEDDYDKAREIALEKDVKVLINFTGKG